MEKIYPHHFSSSFMNGNDIKLLYDIVLFDFKILNLIVCNKLSSA